MHQNFIFNAPGGVGCKARALFGLKGRDSLDQADRSDGDQILLIGCLRVIFLHDVRDEPQIPFDEDIPRLKIPLGRPRKIVPLLLGAQRLRKRTAAREPQRIENPAEHQPYGSIQHSNTSKFSLFGGGKSILYGNSRNGLSVPGRFRVSGRGS